MFYVDWLGESGEQATAVLADKYEELAKKHGISEQALQRLFQGLNRGHVPPAEYDAEIRRILDDFKRREEALREDEMNLRALIVELEKSGQPMPALVQDSERALLAARAALDRGDLDRSKPGLIVVKEAAASGSKFGLRICPVAGREAYVQSDHPANEQHYVARFQLNPDPLPATIDSEGVVFSAFDSEKRTLYDVVLRSSGGRASARLVLDESSSSQPVTLAKGWSKITVEWSKNRLNGAAKATLSVGTQSITLESRGDTGKGGVDFVRLGAPRGERPGLAGCFYVDEFESYR